MWSAARRSMRGTKPPTSPASIRAAGPSSIARESSSAVPNETPAFTWARRAVRSGGGQVCARVGSSASTCSVMPASRASARARSAWSINMLKATPCENCRPSTTNPTSSPTGSPTSSPTSSPTASPTASPTSSPLVAAAPDAPPTLGSPLEQALATTMAGGPACILGSRC